MKINKKFCSSKEICYTLGFLFADGYLNGADSVKIEGSPKDLNKLLKIFKKFHTWKIYKRTRIRKGTITHSVCFAIHKRSLVAQLEKFGYSKFRDMKKALSIIPNKYKYMWYRGLYDGDGCYYKHKKQYLYQISICSNIDFDWSQFIKDFPYFKISKRKLKSGSSSLARISNKLNIIKFIKYIYPNQYDKIGLKRKFVDLTCL